MNKRRFPGLYESATPGIGVLLDENQHISRERKPRVKGPRLEIDDRKDFISINTQDHFSLVVERSRNALTDEQFI